MLKLRYEPVFPALVFQFAEDLPLSRPDDLGNFIFHLVNFFLHGRLKIRLSVIGEAQVGRTVYSVNLWRSSLSLPGFKRIGGVLSKGVGVAQLGKEVIGELAWLSGALQVLQEGFLLLEAQVRLLLSFRKLS